MEAVQSYERIMVRVPRREARKFRAVTRALGYTVLPTCGLDEAIEDVEAGRVSKAFTSTEELFKHLGI